MNSSSVLIILATDRLGLDLLRSLAAHPSKPAVHVLTRSASTLSWNDVALCASVVEGDSRKSSDVRQALLSAMPDTVVLSIGRRRSSKSTDVPTTTAKVLADLLRDDPAFGGVRVVTMSNVARRSGIFFDFSLGKAFAFVKRYVIKDFSGKKEDVMDKSLRRETLVVGHGFRADRWENEGGSCESTS